MAKLVTCSQQQSILVKCLSSQRIGCSRTQVQYTKLLPKSHTKIFPSFNFLTRRSKIDNYSLSFCCPFTTRSKVKASLEAIPPLSIPFKDENTGLWIVRFNPSIDPKPPDNDNPSQTPVALLSFVPRSDSSSVLPLHAIVGWFIEYPKQNGSDYDIEPHNFIENSKFSEFLQQVIKKYIASCPELHMLVKTVGQGPLPICDQRSHLPLHRMPTVDILGVVFVQNGVIIPDSYEPNPAYRLVSPHDGIFKLFPSLHERLLQEFTRSQ